MPAAVCATWRGREREGETYTAIAADGQWAIPTVWAHCNEKCPHSDGPPSPRPNDPPRATLVEILHELAAEKGRSPTAAEVASSDHPVSKGTYERAFGTFSAALAAADLPVVAGGTPDRVRELLYRETR